MAITTGILPGGLGSSTVRSPLQIKTTSSSPTSTLKQIRRKTSFLRRADSSEDYPSPHESIFEAFYFSASNSDESNSRIELITLYPYGAPNDENIGPSTPPIPSSIDDVQFRYGHGTVLETIVEQKTGRTNRTVSRAKSLDNMPNFPFLNHRDSFVLAKNPRRKQSFSLDDLALINRYYHEACTNIEKETCKPLPLFVPEIYAQPKKPLHAPPDRPPTPPGMPSWTAAQSIPPQGRLTYTPARQSRLQRLFGLPASGLTVSSRIPTSNGLVDSRDRVVSAPTRGRTAPRFRPPRSAYGPLDQHPFSRAPIACVVSGTPSTTMAQGELTTLAHFSSEPGMAEFRRQKSRRRRLMGNRVRFTPSATARDSQNIALQSAIESTTANAFHPLTPMQDLLRSQAAPTPGECHHIRNRSPKKISLSGGHDSSRNMTPPSIEYGNLPPASPGRSEQFHSLGLRQSLSPVLSRITAISSSPNLRDVLDLGDINTTPTPATTPESNTRLSSAHSAAPLMSGALRRSLRSTSDLVQQPQVFIETNLDAKPRWCWRCKFDEGCKMVDRLWMNSMGFLCFICCGFDVDEDENVGYRDRYTTASIGEESRSCPRAVGPRRVVLEPSGGMF